jgi:antitoxin VapB
LDRQFQIDDTRMAQSPKDPETDRLAREAAKLTGETLTEAVRNSQIDRLARERLRRVRPAQRLAAALDALACECVALPDLDTRSADEILGYDQNGMWR